MGKRKKAGRVDPKTRPPDLPLDPKRVAESVEQRTCTLTIRVTPSERQMIYGLAERLGVTRTALIVGLARQARDALDAEE